MSTTESKTDFRPPDRRLLLAFVLGPIAALTNLVVTYTLVPEACERRSELPLHATAALCLLVALFAGFLAWRSPHRDDERLRWMSLVGVVLSIVSVVVIIAMDLPSFMLGSCG